MKLLKLEANNIFSLGKVELNLDNRGLVLVTGYSYDEGGFNGSGKSSLTSKAILWTLYGKLVSETRGVDVVNRHSSTKKDCYGCVTFQDRSQNIIKVYRSKTQTTGLKLYKNNEDITQKLQTNTQELINKFTGYTFDEFVRIAFFGQGLTEVFLNTTPSFQKSLLEKILPFETIDELIEKTNIVYDKYKLKKLKISNDKIIHQQIYENVLIDRRQLEKQKNKDLQEQINAQNQLLKLPGPNNDKDLQQIIDLTKLEIDYVTIDINTIKEENELTTKICKECKQPLNIKEQVIKNSNLKNELTDRLNILKLNLEKYKLKQQVMKTYTIDTSGWDELIKEKTKSLEEHNKLIQEYFVEEDKYSVKLKEIGWWINTLKTTIRLSLLQTACPVLTENTNFFLQKLKNPQIKIKFECQDNNFTHDIISTTGGHGYHSLSGGEQQIVNFAVGLSLGALTRFIRGDNFRPSLLILDEPFTMLDNRNAEAVVEFLTNSDIAETILLVSNDPSLMSLIPNNIKIIKRNGISELEN